MHTLCSTLRNGGAERERAWWEETEAQSGVAAQLSEVDPSAHPGMAMDGTSVHCSSYGKCSTAPNGSAKRREKEVFALVAYIEVVICT